MPTEVSEVGPCKRKITVSVPAERVKEVIEQAWQEARQNVTLKGFRPGKVPKHILEKKFGKAVREEVKQQLINDAFREALEEHKLHPVRQPEIDADEMEVDPSQPLEFELTFEVRPEFEVPEFRGIDASAPPVMVTDEIVEREMEHIRSQRAKVEPIEDGVTAKGDFLLADVSYQVDGAIVLHHEKAVVDTLRNQIDGIPAEDTAARFAGKEIGATVAVTTRLPDDFKPSGFAAAEANLLCTIKQIRRITLPEADDEFARDLGAESLADLRTKVSAQVERQLNSQRDRYIEECVLDELIKRTAFDLPQDLLEQSTERRMREFEADLVGSGMPEAEAKSNVATHGDRIRQDEARGLRISFLVEKIAEAERLFVTEDEMEANVRALASIQDRKAQDVYDELYDRGGLPALRAQILERKVRKLIRETANVSDGVVEQAGS